MADRLISADAFDNALTELRFNADGGLAHWGDRKDWCLHGSEIEKLIADAPTIDAVPVVRCKDCKYYEETDGRIGTCLLTVSGAEVDGFCSWGEGSEDEQSEINGCGINQGR